MVTKRMMVFVPVVVKALSPRKEVVLKDNQHSSNNISSSSKVAIKEEARVVVIKGEGSRVVTKADRVVTKADTVAIKADTVATKVDNLKGEEVGHKGVDAVVEVAVIHSSMLQEELRHLSDVVGLDLGRPFPSCTKQHKLLNSLCRHCSQRHLEHQLKCMPSHYPPSRWWMSQRISCSSYQCSKKNPASLSHMPPANKSLRFPLRPGKGRIRESCIVKANHFFC
ncbi:hypothetical protein HanXRQr2_Chr11g0505881 [Helianthus annuus]|uniref:Uncharacterized protein n=1 Tax=Helianthus annuus TaxID=4232 RepID=A0A9K3N188_HELAN|nr:hypothetical protein HanXRQr2_Chr11g0505881 [Helianthus annuus]KAJ0518580.1 hypothetical protein HanHA89_Chr11g0439051 [Helianthus annuus]KAJ0686618.1 hypothetical protein HanLR1_Chr11g0416761 [Helianthus annuus]KAJ0690432.1 hypothetical protein HanOQP8_Chr11g0417761 [Helianthus annuus]